MIYGAGCCTVLHAAHHFCGAQPSHSDDFRNALEPIGLDTAVTEYPDFDDDLMATR
ncbi:hypothetical protein O987_17915 [Comamonas testosteroni TK102]|nr:hypothetical protein O987_17915 [Comamonas testosteroni TK102]